MQTVLYCRHRAPAQEWAELHYAFSVFYEHYPNGSNEDVYEISQFISEARDGNMQNGDHYIPAVVWMQIRNPIMKKKEARIWPGWLMNARSSKLPMAERGRLTRANFHGLKRGKWDLWRGATGLRAAPSPDLR